MTPSHSLLTQLLLLGNCVKYNYSQFFLFCFFSFPSTCFSTYKSLETIISHNYYYLAYYVAGYIYAILTMAYPPTTTCRELLSGAVNRLGEDILELCPAMKDREDEEEIQQNFCFVLAQELERDGIISYHAKRLLNLGECILPLFSAPDSAANCLMLHTAQQEHGVMEEERSTVKKDTGRGDKTEPTAKAELGGGEEPGEGERELEGEEGRVKWRRQQVTVIIYDDQNGYMEEADFEENEEMATIEEEHHAPSKSVNIT